MEVALTQSLCSEARTYIHEMFLRLGDRVEWAFCKDSEESLLGCSPDLALMDTSKCCGLA